jgi:hypothetical protein
MIQATLFLISYIFLIAIVIVYFDYMSRIVGLILLNSCNCSYSVYPINWWVDGRQYVDVVSRYLVYLRGHPDVPGRVVVRTSDRYIGSSVVHPPYVGQHWRGREGGDGCVLKPSLVDASLHVIMI